MAFMYISEFSGLAATAQSDSVPIAAEPPIAVQKIAIAVGSTPSAAFNAATKFIEVEVDAICSFIIGAATPVATVANMRLNANDRIQRGVTPGQMIANIANT